MTWKLGSFMTLLMLVIGGGSSHASTSSSREVAQKLFNRLTGTPLRPSDPRLAEMVRWIDQGDLQKAAAIATDDDQFYNVRIRNFAQPLSDREENPTSGLNDFVATVIGTVRDEIDARQLLTGDYLYVGPSGAVDGRRIPVPSEVNNNHFDVLDAQFINLAKELKKVTPQSSTIPESAGLLTTRAWGEAHYTAGTNRRAVEFTFKVFMCRTMDQMQDLSVTDEWVRRDVDRAPGGSALTFQSKCVGCHGGMDGLGGAFSRFDFKQGAIQYYSGGRVAQKYNQNADVYPFGHITIDDSWVNYWTKNQNEKLGWRGPLSGKGIKAFGEMISRSRGFSQCMVRRSFREVCKRDPHSSDEEAIHEITEQFEKENYNLKRLFQEVAISPSCLGE